MSINPKFFFCTILIISSTILLAAYYIDFIGLSAACKLCVYERFPYFAAILISLLAFNNKKNNKFYIYLLLLVALTSVALSSFHIAVEQKWYDYSSPCSASDLASGSIEELKAKIEKKDLISCDQSDYKIFGITLATWNFILSLTLFLLTIRYLRHDKKNRSHKRILWH